MSKLVALDLETTGNNPDKDQILQIAAIVLEFGDLDTPVEELPSFSTLIKRDRYTGNPFALSLNAWIFDKLAKGEGVDSWTAMKKFSDFLDENEVNLANTLGFNVASFDLLFLKNEVMEQLQERFPKTTVSISAYEYNVHPYGASPRYINPNKNRFETTWEDGQFFSPRAIELGTLYATPEGPAKSSTTVRNYLKKEVSHDALEDCQDAVNLWRMWVRRQKTQ